MEDARGEGRTFGVGLMVPRVRDMTGALGELEDRMTTGAELGHQVSSLMGVLLSLADDAQLLLGQFAADRTDLEPWTSETLKATLVSIGENTLSAQGRVEEATRLISDTGQAHQLLPRLASLDRVLEVLATVSETSMVVLDAVEPTVKDKGGLLGEEGGLIEILDAFAERSDQVAQAIVDLEETGLTLDELVASGDTAYFADGLFHITKLVDDLHSGLRLAHGFAPVGRGLFGGEGIRRYLVLGQSADELRATGGFISGVWLVTFEDGALTTVKYHDSVRVDDWDRINLYPKAPPGLEEHMNAWVWLLRDVSWDPDFPTSARSAEDIYRLGQHEEVEGVIAINQWTLLRLTEALGHIPSPGGGEPVTARNLLTTLERGTDQHGRAYMDLVFQNVLDELEQRTSLTMLIRLASGILATLERRDTLVFFEDTGVQETVRRFGWDGEVRRGDTDFLYVVDSNVGWNKVDRSVQRDVTYVVDLSRVYPGHGRV